MPPADRDPAPPAEPVRGPRSAVGLVLENVATLGASEILARGIGFLATVYVARTLGVEAYGVVGFALSVTLYLWAATDFGVELGGPREIAAAAATGGWVRAVIFGRLAIAGILGVPTVLVGWFVLPSPDGRILALYGLTLLPVAVGVRWVLIGVERTRAVAFGRLGAEAMRALLLVWLVRASGDLPLVPLTQLAAEGIVAAGLILVAVRVRRLTPGPVDWREARRILRRTAPLALTTLLGLMVYNADLIMLRIFRTRADVGLYFSAFALVTLVGNVGNAMRTALIPTLTRVRADPDVHTAVWHAGLLLGVTIGLPIAVAGWMLASDVLGTVFGPTYVGGAPALAVLVISIPLLMARGAMEAVAVAEGRSDIVLRETALGATVNVSANLVAIPAFGLVGAALTTVLTELIRASRMILRMRELGAPLPPPARFRHVAAATTLMAIVLWLLGPGRLWISVAGGGVTFVAATLLTGGYRLGVVSRTPGDEATPADEVDPQADDTD